MITTNYYSVLGLPAFSSSDKIKEAFHKLMKEYHPDKNSSPAAKEKTQCVIKAYDILRDPKKKADFDKELRDSLKRPHTADMGDNASTGWSPPIRTTQIFRPDSEGFTFSANGISDIVAHADGTWMYTHTTGIKPGLSVKENGIHVQTNANGTYTAFPSSSSGAASLSGEGVNIGGTSNTNNSSSSTNCKGGGNRYKKLHFTVKDERDLSYDGYTDLEITNSRNVKLTKCRNIDVSNVKKFTAEDCTDIKMYGSKGVSRTNCNGIRIIHCTGVVLTKCKDVMLVNCPSAVTTHCSDSDST